MSLRTCLLITTLCLAGTARAEDGAATDLSSWALLLFGLFAIGVYAALQMRRD